MSLARNTAYNLLGSLVPLAASFVTVPIYLRVIGLERYGLLAICWVLLGYMEVLEFGLGTATAQRIALRKSKSPESRSEIACASLILALAVGCTGALVLFAAAPSVVGWTMDARSAFTRELTHSILWLSLLVPLTTCYSVLSGALQGREEFLRLNLINGSANAALAVAPLGAALFFGPELPVLIVALIIVRAVAVAALLFASQKAVPLDRPRTPSRQTFKSLVTFGGWVTGEGFLAPILLSAEKLALGWLRTATAVSFYMIPFNILSRLLMLPQSFAAALIPDFARMDASEADQAARAAFRNLELLVTPLSLLAVLALKPFLIVWIGSTLAAVCTPVGIVLITGFWFNSFTHVSYARLIGTGRPDLVVKLVLVQLPPYLALLYIAIDIGGLIGAALVWSLRGSLELVLFLAATRQLALLADLILPVVLLMSAAGFAFWGPISSLAVSLVLTMLVIFAIIRSSRLSPYRGLLEFARPPRLKKSH